MKYLKENILNPRNTHDESFKLIKARWNDGIRPITLVKKYHWGIYENLFAQTNQDSAISHSCENSKMFNITSKYLSFFFKVHQPFHKL